MDNPRAGRAWHRPTPSVPDLSAPVPGARAALRRNARLVALGNAIAGCGLLFGEQGASGSLTVLGWLLPLGVWAAVLITAAVLQVSAKLVVLGHCLGAFVWIFLAESSAVALLQGRSVSTAGSAVVVGMAVALAGLHLNGVWWRQTDRIVQRRPSPESG